MRIIPKTTYAERPLHDGDWAALFADVRMPMTASPIELRAAEAFAQLLTDPAEFGPPAYVNLFLPVGAVRGFEEFPPINLKRTAGTINVMPECQVGSYRVDFYLEVKPYGTGHRSVAGAMECDGERSTPGQRSRPPTTAVGTATCKSAASQF